MRLQLFVKRSSTALYISTQHAETSSNHILLAFLVQIENYSTCTSTNTLLKSSISPIQYHAFPLPYTKILRFFHLFLCFFMYIFVCDNRKVGIILNNFTTHCFTSSLCVYFKSHHSPNCLNPVMFNWKK